MLPQIVRTLINLLPGKSHQSFLPNGSYATVAPKNCRGFRHQRSADFFIPQGLTPDSSNLLSQSIIQAKESTGSLEIWDVLAAMVTDPSSRRIALIGSPGSGKTSLLEYIQRSYAENRHKQHHSGVPHLIPVRLCLPDIQPMIAQNSRLSLLELIAPGETPEKQQWSWLLDRGECLVMLDGLDEVDSSNDPGDSLEERSALRNRTSARDQISHWIEQQMQAYPNTPFAIAATPSAYHLKPLAGVGMVLELQPFSDQQIQQFLHHWYQVSDRYSSSQFAPEMNIENKSKRLLAEIKSVRSVANMATNPLLLTAIAQVYDLGQIPTRRVELYQALCDVLLNPIGKNEESFIAKKTFLQKLGLGLMQQKTNQFTSNSLGTLLGEQVAALPELESFGGLLVEIKPGVYKFSHKSFQEYLAAVQIKDSQQEELLVKNIQNLWWHETIKFYTAMSDNYLTDVIEAALSASNTLNLAYDCLQDNYNVPLPLQKIFNLKLDSALESTTPSIFKSAAKVRLKQRCQNLLHSQNSVAIDPDYITNAEYQLFIDDRRKLGQSRQPDHWRSKQFPPGKSQEAIAGVRGSDAEEFCEWLTQQYAGYGVKFRLPTFAEVQSHPAHEEHLGAWCYAEKDKAIAGFSEQFWQEWQQQIAIALDRDLEQLRRQQKALKLDLTRTLTREIALKLAEAQKEQLLEQISQRLQRGKSHELVKNLAHLHELVFTLSNVDKFEQIREFALKISKVRQLFALRQLVRSTPGEFDVIRQDFLLIYICFHCLHSYQITMSENSAMSWSYSKNVAKEVLKPSHYYEQKKNEALNLYAFFVLIHQRHFHQLPAFEGIRIVKESVA
jgi:NACHT domain